VTFRLRITLAMICLVSLAYSIGGAALMNASFEASLARERSNVQESLLFLASALSSVSEAQAWTKAEDAVQTLSNLSAGDGFSVVQLQTKDELLFTRNDIRFTFADYRDSIGADQLSVGVFVDDRERLCLQATACLSLRDVQLYLSLGRDATSIRDAYETQLALFRQIFWVMLALCAALAYGLSAFLTRPLNRLSRSARAIASGKLSARSRIPGNDEIADLSRDFDRMAERVEESMDELRDAMRRRELFMGSFTHELKTPMTSIIGYADLIRGENLSPEELQEAADTIFREGRRLEHLSMLLLDIFVADKRELRMKLTRICDLAESVASQLRPIYEKQGIAITVQAERAYARVEPDLVRTLLLNLMDNARKAMPEGGEIRICVSSLPEGTRLRVCDNGIGIPREAIRHLTEAFYRVDKQQARAQGGTGLGLALCQKIAELHHGEIRFESEEGEGTTVTVDLPGGAL